MKKLNEKQKEILIKIKDYVLWTFIFFLALNGWLRIADNNTTCEVSDFSGSYNTTYNEFIYQYCENNGFLNTGMTCYPNEFIDVYCKIDVLGFEIKILEG